MGKRKKKRRSEWALKAAIATALLQLVNEIIKLLRQLLDQ